MSKKIQLTVEDWCQLAKEGVAVPITTTLKGFSMEPLIRYMKDPITIIPINRALIPGDVVLFEREDGKLVVHRLYKIIDERKMVQTWGDNCEAPDPPITASRVLGIVVSFEKNGKQILLDSDEQRKRGLKWLESKIRRPAWLAYQELLERTAKTVKKFC